MKKTKRLRGANPRPVVLNASALTPTPLRPVGPSLRYIIYKLKRVAYVDVWKKKSCRGANPRTMVLNACALPIHHSDLLFLVPFPRHMTYDKSYHHREEIKYNRSEWCSGRALAFKTIGRGFAPRQRFVFFTRRRSV